MKWPEDKGGDNGATVWNTAAKDTQWFGPNESNLMSNYRVDETQGLLAQFKRDGLGILKAQSDEIGHFVWIMDPDGNELELWQPLAKE